MCDDHGEICHPLDFLCYVPVKTPETATVSISDDYKRDRFVFNSLVSFPQPTKMKTLIITLAALSAIVVVQSCGFLNPMCQPQCPVGMKCGAVRPSVRLQCK